MRVEQQNILRHPQKELGQKLLVKLKYKKYFRKTSLKQKGIGKFFLKEIEKKKPKTFLEVGVFHGVTARNVCELLKDIHGDQFKYTGIDLFGDKSTARQLRRFQPRHPLSLASGPNSARGHLHPGQ